MACVVLGVCGFWWVSFCGSPNLLLGSVLSANPAGFICPVHETQLYHAGVVSYLFHSKSHIHLHQSYSLLMSTGLMQPTLPHNTLLMEEGRRVKSTGQDSGISCGWSGRKSG